MKKLFIIVSILLFLCSDAFAASALTGRGSYLKVFWGTSSRRVLNSDCIAEDDPVFCCTGEDTGTCNVEYYYRDNGHCTTEGVPYSCCTGADTGTCEDVYTSEQSITPNAESTTVTGTFNLGTTYYFSSKAYSTKAYGCKSTPCDSDYSNETSWVADSTTTVDLGWDKYGYESFLLTTGNQLKIVFDEAVYTSTDDDSEFSFTNCADCAVTYQSGSGTNTLYYTFSGTIDRTTTTTYTYPYIMYTPSASIDDAEGNPVDNFSSYLLMEYGTTAAPTKVIFIE